MSEVSGRGVGLAALREARQKVRTELETAEKELWNGTTLVGPHRDEVAITLDGMPARVRRELEECLVRSDRRLGVARLLGRRGELELRVRVVRLELDEGGLRRRTLPPVERGIDVDEALARELFANFTLPFEVVSVLLLATLYLTKTREEAPRRGRTLPLLLALAVGAMLVWGTLVLPPFGTPDAPIHPHVAPRYINEVIAETGVPNIVTAVLADYRGFDTLGETTVIFIAGIGVMLLLSGLRRTDPEEGTPEDPS